MRIVYASNINLNIESGAKNHVNELKRYLEKNNEVLSFGNSYKIELRNYQKFFLNFFFNVILFFKLLFNHLSRPVDAIYSRQNILFATPAIFSKVFSIPHVIELNGTIEEELIANKYPRALIRLNNLIEGFSYKNCQKIICNSNGLKKYVSKKFKLSLKKIKVVGMGVNEKRFKPGEINSSNKLTIGYIGGLQFWQGVDYIIKAFSIVEKKIPSSRLRIVGDGNEKERLINLTNELGLNKKVKFLGQVANKKIPLNINKTDICVCYLTRFKEGRYGPPTKVFEYLSCSKPTIISDISGVSQLFNSEVVLFAKPEDEKDLAEKIIYLLKNKRKRESLRKKSREFILRNYTWNKIGKKTEKILKDAL
jgi:starch synthase